MVSDGSSLDGGTRGVGGAASGDVRKGRTGGGLANGGACGLMEAQRRKERLPRDEVVANGSMGKKTVDLGCGWEEERRLAVDPVVHDVLGRLGGWPALCESDGAVVSKGSHGRWKAAVGDGNGCAMEVEAVVGTGSFLAAGGAPEGVEVNRVMECEASDAGRPKLVVDGGATMVGGEEGVEEVQSAVGGMPVSLDAGGGPTAMAGGGGGLATAAAGGHRW